MRELGGHLADRTGLLGDGWRLASGVCRTFGLRKAQTALAFASSPVMERRGSQVVRQGSAKALCVGSIPTLASNVKGWAFLLFSPQLPANLDRPSI